MTGVTDKSDGGIGGHGSEISGGEDKGEKREKGQ